MRVLVVEDNTELREQLIETMKDKGYVVDAAEEGVQGLYYAKEYPIDIAIIDLGLPNLDGMEIVKQLREAGKDYPVIILTARTHWKDRILGLEAGADDYMDKPFHHEELLARMRALQRRVGRWTQSEFACGPISLNTSEQRVLVDKNEVSLTAYEYKVIEHLMMHAGEVISKTDLTESMYDDDSDRDSNVIEVFIRRLRMKLDPDALINPIETLRGRGYRFTLERNHV